MTNEPVQQDPPSEDRNGAPQTESEVRELAISAHTVALRKALYVGIAGWLALSVLSVVLWMLVDGTPGVWGALVGAGIGGFFVLTTAITTLATAKSPATTMGAVLMGTWLLKLLIVLGVVFVIRDFDFYSRPALVVTMVLSLVVVLSLETWTIVKAKAPAVEPDIFR
ncbi:MAG TPA: hypothetical protein K8V11_11510 [Dietzia timorensis]|uniref:ATP synthase protein I n=1 Tax=Dietzia timorensis TaxID=499555 RepID=A0A921F4V5_9ACTN|nr:hypothetical protein [Dietzia timorensis]HJE91621.1 hypothetical protein [Dietzia timorensis]